MHKVLHKMHSAIIRACHDQRPTVTNVPLSCPAKRIPVLFAPPLVVAFWRGIRPFFHTDPPSPTHLTKCGGNLLPSHQKRCAIHSQKATHPTWRRLTSQAPLPRASPSMSALVNHPSPWPKPISSCLRSRNFTRITLFLFTA